jgi:pimeloyl-ACP methyl ester carboxylesterase
MAPTPGTVRSLDGTTIAYERSGSGPPLVLVDGALQRRTMGPSRPLAEQLAARFTVFAYDRRGRGDSGDTPPYAPEREIEDLEALIGAAGGSAFVYGVSAGAALALDAANRGAGITKVAVYEAWFVVDDTVEPLPADFQARLEAAIAEGRCGDAVRQFMRRLGVPGLVTHLMRLTPPFRKLKEVAHTLPYDFAVLGDTQSGRPLPAERWAGVRVPVLLLVGGKSPASMRNGMAALAAVVPGARLQVLDGQTHVVKPKAHAPVLTEFFGEP